MLRNTPTDNADDRAVAPAVGYIIIIAFVVTVSIALAGFAAATITDGDATVDAEFESNVTLNADETISVALHHADGDAITSSNTDRLYAIGEPGSNSDVDDVMLFNSSGDGVIDAGTVVLSESRAAGHGVEPGDELRIVWEPTGVDDVQVSIDTVVVPGEETIRLVCSPDGSGQCS